MAFIYMIYNDINDKIYVGQTRVGLSARFQDHIQKSKNPKCVKNRPLYKAMNKYGADKFHIQLLEETDHPKEREIYWIQKLHTYHYGYNATLGGEGRSFIDITEILNLWNQGLMCSQIAKLLGHDNGHIGVVLRGAGITMDEIQQRGHDSHNVPVRRIDIKNNTTIDYNSKTDAARDLIISGCSKSSLSTIGTHISEVCQGKRTTCWGFKWEFI